MKTKHTPKPWEIKIHDKGPYFTEVEVWHQNYGRLAIMQDNTSIWNSEKNEEVAKEALDQTIANAKVMVAGPELFGACKMVLEELYFGGDWKNAKKILGEAIQKATP